MLYEQVLIVVFWITAIGSLWSFLIYPVVLWGLPRRRRKLPEAVDVPPTMTVVITVCNEEKKIARKLEQTLQLDYPRNLLDIVVASDGSTDSTVEICERFRARGVRVVRNEGRKGKEFAQESALQDSHGELVVFTDVAADTNGDALLQFARDLSDPTVGAVSSTDRLRLPGGESLYQYYETKLRELESSVNTSVVVTGALFACRRVVCQDWDCTIPSDFGTALRCIRSGYRVASDPAVFCYYDNVAGEAREYWRKFRTTVRGITAMWRNRELLNPHRYRFAAFQLWSHKVLRWAMPWFMGANTIVSGALALDAVGFRVVFSFQVAAIAIAALATTWPVLRKSRLARLCSYVAIVNVAMAHAAVAFALGKRITAWQPSLRQDEL